MSTVAECNTCRQILPLEMFAKNKSTKSGYAFKCKPCTNAYDRQWRAGLSPENQVRRAKKKRITKTLPAVERKHQMLRKYGLTIEAYEVILAAQNGVCRICELPETTLGKNGIARRLCVDHDHSCCPGKVTCGKCIRGLLCIRCNAALGHFRDDPKNLVAAIAYLESSSPQVNRAI
jgi:hypothetical protein